MANELLDVETLRKLREARGWDQQTLALRAGIDPSALSRLERNLQDDLRASGLVALARALDVPVEALLLSPISASPLNPELTAAVTRLSTLPPAHQRQVAAILTAYLATLPE